jgi:hypothetical protein
VLIVVILVVTAVQGWTLTDVLAVIVAATAAPAPISARAAVGRRTKRHDVGAAGPTVHGN